MLFQDSFCINEIDFGFGSFIINNALSHQSELLQYFLHFNSFVVQISIITVQFYVQFSNDL